MAQPEPTPASPRPRRGWRFWIDRGGTFTDVIGVRPDGAVLVAKELSEDPDRHHDAAIAGIRRLMKIRASDPLPLDQIIEVRMGTTVGTNALLERKGAATALVTTAGLGDQLRIGTQDRPDLFALDIRLPAPLHDWVVEVEERVAADGRVLVPLNEAPALEALQRVRALGADAVAICLMHGYRHPAHERRLAELARQAGFAQVSTSHEVAPVIRYVGRAATTVADAYLSPALGAHVARVADALPGVLLSFMKSDGGLAHASRFRGRDSILSGPAGGIVGAVESTRLLGYERIIGFDMGGTSTDVAHWAGAYEREEEEVVKAGQRLRVPMLAIHTIASGGGSILAFDGHRLRVGPDSAGAHPGPACYRNGGPLTITDANLVLGRLNPDHFPTIFGPDRDQPLDRAAALARFMEMIADIAAATGRRPRVEQLAGDFLTLAVDAMAQAIGTITTARGRDISGHVLACFGGAGGQHGCLVAERLGIATVVLHPLAGVLSAHGIGLARASLVRQETIDLDLQGMNLPLMTAAVDRLSADARASLAVETGRAVTAAWDIAVLAMIRPAASETALPVPFGTLETMIQDFRTAHRELFGYLPELGTPLVLADIRVEVAVPPHAPRRSDKTPPEPRHPRPLERHPVWFQNRWQEAAFFRRGDLRVGDRFAGPAVIVEKIGTIIIEPGWHGHIEDDDVVVLERGTARPAALAQSALAQAPEPAPDRVPQAPDPARLALFGNLFMSIATQMGVALQRTARSVNIRDRLDFSCALFTADGDLLANAPHIPVHLGSMGASVRAILARRGDQLRPDSAFLINDPTAGGTHLPDLTVVSPVFERDDPGDPGALLMLVAARGHHADIGGTSPGSMPADSRTLAEEGVCFRDFALVEDGVFQEAALRAALAGGPWPARHVEMNLADLKAQLAANRRGIAALREAFAANGQATVLAYAGHVMAAAETEMRAVLRRLPGGHFVQRMDDGHQIAVTITTDADSGTATVDFSGTSAQHPGNFNAPAAVTRAAVMFVFRTLVERPIPMNEGFLRPLRIVIAPGSLLDPGPEAAVAAGNVEVSQAVANALYGALGVVAQSQGTMNNVTLGSDSWQYYETVAGGSGAGPGFAGADAVHSHMTNSRLTDPEILEARFPVVVERFAVRSGSGGAGQWVGGNGVVRRLRLEAPATLSVLSSMRRVAPQGAAGGGPGEPGLAWIERADGRRQFLDPVARVEVAAGDVFHLETPGGGGYGHPGGPADRADEG